MYAYEKSPYNHGKNNFDYVYRLLDYSAMEKRVVVDVRKSTPINRIRFEFLCCKVNIRT